jgi:hypothetical protein
VAAREYVTLRLAAWMLVGRVVQPLAARGVSP